MKSGHTYAEAHNKAVTTYQKNVSTFFWLGLLNLTGATIGVVSENSHYFPALASNVAIFRELDQVISEMLVLSSLKILIAAITSFCLILVWLLAKKGNKYALHIGISAYALETIVMFIFMSDEPIFVPQILLHLVIIVMFVLALGAYHQIYAIEERFKQKD